MPTTCSGFWNPDGCNLVHPSSRDVGLPTLVERSLTCSCDAPMAFPKSPAPPPGVSEMDDYRPHLDAVPMLGFIYPTPKHPSWGFGNGWLLSTPQRCSRFRVHLSNPKAPLLGVGNGWLLSTPRRHSHVGVQLSNPKHPSWGVGNGWFPSHLSFPAVDSLCASSGTYNINYPQSRHGMTPFHRWWKTSITRLTLPKCLLLITLMTTLGEMKKKDIHGHQYC